MHNKLEHLYDDLNQIKAKAEEHQTTAGRNKSDEYIDYLLKTNNDLKQDNRFLAEKATNICEVQQQMFHKFDYLCNEISQSKDKAEDQPSADHKSKSNEYLSYLLRTNKELKEENKLLAERATNISYVMSDLNTKLKDLENEKASLLTVIKILKSEQVHESNHGHLDWKRVKAWQRRRKNCSARKKTVGNI